MANPSLLAELDRVRGLADALSRQTQCDEDGVLIAVSRQAVDETIALFRRPDFLALIEALREPTEEMACAGFESDAWNDLSDAVMDAGGEWPYSCKQSAECVTGIFKAMLRAALPTKERDDVPAI